MIYFCSDIHLGHKNVLTYCNRPFKDLEEMREAFIKSWNDVVQDNDKVFCLGDFSLNPKHSKEVVPLLKGEKYLVMGNHDAPFKKSKRDRFIKEYHNDGWFNILENTFITIDKYNIELSHFPFAAEPGDKLNNDIRYVNCRPINTGQILLHGHLHCRYLKYNNMIDVGWDNDFKLLSQYDIILIIEDERKFIPSRLTEWYQSEAYKKANEEVRNK